MQEIPNAKEKLWTGQYILILLLGFTTYSAHFILLVSMPLFVISLGGSNTLAGLATGMYSLFAMIFRPLIGSFLDSHGRKHILLLGIIIFLIGMVLSLLTESLGLQLAIRLIQGIGFSIVSTACSTIITDTVPKSRMAEGIGYNAAFITSANSIGPFLGLLIIDLKGFTPLFTSLVPVMATAFILSLFLRENSENLKKVAEKTHVEPKSFRHTAGKIFSIERTSVPASIMMIFISLSYGGIVTFLATYGKFKGIDNIQFFFIILPGVIILTRIFAGSLSDRFGAARIVIPCTILATIALIMLSLSDTVSMFALSAVLYGLGYGSLHPIFNALAVKNCPPEKRGGANATFYIALDLGIGGGSILLGYFSDLFGLSSVYIISAIVMALSLGFYLLIGKRGKAGM